ncbi:host nuclease inhibitor protein [Rahnella contaminans]|uniref:host nuclease inhibitor protein n=1 Tax=Rahnella contaminans TaxID=2703882 RepID=UPI003C2B8C8F
MEASNACNNAIKVCATRKPLTVYAWASGLIGFGYRIPAGALPVASTHDEKTLRDLVEVRARHSRRSNDLFVPGVPEAEGPDAAVDALTRFSLIINNELKEV